MLVSIKEKLVNLEDLKVLKDYSDDSYISKNQGEENKGKSLLINENGNVIVGDVPSTKVDPTFSKSGEAADAKLTGEAIDNMIEHNGNPLQIEFPSIVEFNNLKLELSNKTKKTRIDFDGNKTFKIGNDALNFNDLYEIHLTRPDFAFIVYGDRAYLLSYVQDGAGMKELRFQSVLAVTDSNGFSNTKTSGIYVTSSDGINITSVKMTDINSENKSYKATEITDNNKNDVWYPSTKAVVDYVEESESKILSVLNSLITELRTKGVIS